MDYHIGILGQDKMKLLERSPKIAPLLSQLHQHSAQYHEDHNSEHHAVLAQIMADLLCLDLKQTESELVTDVLLELMRQAERDLRRMLSERLAHEDGVPLRMIQHLANDEITVADPILRHSSVLEDMDLIYIIKSHDSEHWQAIATRPTLNGPVIDVLADTGDVDTAVTLAENRSITLTDYALAQFEPLAGEHENLARPLLSRPDVPQEITARIYAVVGDELKKSLEGKFDVPAQRAAAHIDDIVFEVRQAARAEYMPSDKLIQAAMALKQKGSLDVPAMLGNLKRGMMASFIAQLAAYTDMTSDTILSALTQKSGQDLAVICKAFDIRKVDFISFYLMSHRLRKSYQPVIDNQQFMMAIQTYDRIKRTDAYALLKNKRIIH